jgi:hypothetical protein
VSPGRGLQAAEAVLAPQDKRTAIKRHRIFMLLPLNPPANPRFASQAGNNSGYSRTNQALISGFWLFLRDIFNPHRPPQGRNRDYYALSFWPSAGWRCFQIAGKAPDHPIESRL